MEPIVELANRQELSVHVQRLTTPTRMIGTLSTSLWTPLARELGKPITDAGYRLAKGDLCVSRVGRLVPLRFVGCLSPFLPRRIVAARVKYDHPAQPNNVDSIRYLLVALKKINHCSTVLKMIPTLLLPQTPDVERLGRIQLVTAATPHGVSYLEYSHICTYMDICPVLYEQDYDPYALVGQTVTQECLAAQCDNASLLYALTHT
ncbi:hypothetical protein CBL_07361 [Carabus blaptoides fortunei]